MIVNPDTQVANCCRAIVRFILSRNLRAGDKLPPQDELRGSLSFSHNSVTPAMNLLVESGLLERKRRQGTIVVDPEAVPSGLWRVAMPFGVLDLSPECQFETILSRYLQETCQKKFCHLRYYILNVDKIGLVPHDLDDFGLLRYDLEDGRLDGILTPAFFTTEASQTTKRLGVPLCNVGGWPLTPIRVGLDSRAFIRMALDYLRPLSCERPLVVMNVRDQNEMMDELNDCDESVEVADHPSLGGAKGLAESLLANSRESRPDALIIANDIVALELVSILAGTDYTPRVVVQSNKQIPLFFHRPVVKLEYDIKALADIAVSVLLAKIQGQYTDDEVRTLRPELCES